MAILKLGTLHTGIWFKAPADDLIASAEMGAAPLCGIMMA